MSTYRYLSDITWTEADRRIWKHGVAVTVESKLDDRNVLGKQLFEVGLQPARILVWSETDD